MPSLYCDIDGFSNIISANVQSGHPSSTSSAVIECISTTKDIGDFIEIDLGYSDNHKKVFSGYIKQKSNKAPENTIMITANDVLIRAMDYFVVSSDPETPFTRQNIKAEDFIQDILELAGLTSFDFDATDFTLAISVPAEVNLISAYDYANSIAEYVAWHLYADEDGVIHFLNRKPYVMVSGQPDDAQPGFVADSSLKTIDDSNILEFDLRYDERDLRNRVVVYGTSGIFASVSRATSWNPVTDTYQQILPADFYKTIAAAVPFIDTIEMAQKAADYNLQLYNRLGVKGSLSILGDPDLLARKVITVDNTILGINTTFYIYSAEHSWSKGGYNTSMELRK